VVLVETTNGARSCSVSMALSNKSHYNIKIPSWCVVYLRSEHIGSFHNATSSDYVKRSSLQAIATAGE
jgi:hypothetical protein